LSLAVSVFCDRLLTLVVRIYGLCTNAHRGKVLKASLGAFPLWIVEEELRRIPSKGWAAMIRKVNEVGALRCPRCGGAMRVVSFLTDYTVVDRIIDNLKLTFTAAAAPPSEVAFQELLMASDLPAEYCP
jgi:hypothetical protein